MVVVKVKEMNIKISMRLVIWWGRIFIVMRDIWVTFIDYFKVYN